MPTMVLAYVSADRFDRFGNMMTVPQFCALGDWLFMARCGCEDSTTEMGFVHCTFWSSQHRSELLR
jgi:hypothetical protein